MVFLLTQIIKLFGMSSPLFALGVAHGLLVVISMPLDPLLKKSSRGRVTRTMREFYSFMARSSLRDSPLLNSQFTRSNGREHPNLCHLNRFLVSTDWEEIFPLFYQEASLRFTFGSLAYFPPYRALKFWA